MDYDEFVDSTQDNTQVRQIMGDFQDFLRRQTTSGYSSMQHLEDIHRNSSLTQNEENLSFNIDVKVKLNRLQKQHSSEKQSLVKSNIALESECSKLHSQIMKLQERYDAIELKNKQLTETNLDLIDKVRDAEKFKDEEIAKWKTNYEKLEKLKEESDKRTFSELSEYEDKCNELQEQNMSLQTEVNNLTLQLEEALSISELYNKKITDSVVLAQQHQQSLNELASAKLQIHSLTTRLNDVEDLEKNVQCFKENLERLRFLEVENKGLLEQNIKLKENQENTVLLNEKLLSMEQKLTRSQAKCTRADELEVINQSLERQLNDFESKTRAEPAANQLLTEVSQLQSHVQMLKHRNQLMQNDYESLQRKLNEEKHNQTKLNATIEEQSESIASLSAQLLRLKKRAALLSRERDSLRDILQSYDAELTMTSHTTQLSKRLTNAEDANTKLHTRIEQLEAELQKSAEELMRQRLLAKHVTNPLKQEEKAAPQPNVNKDLEEEVAQLKKNVIIF